MDIAKVSNLCDLDCTARVLSFSSSWRTMRQIFVGPFRNICFEEILMCDELQFFLDNAMVSNLIIRELVPHMAFTVCLFLLFQSDL